MTARPVPVSRVWSGDDVIAEDVQGDDLGDVLELHSEASAWWVLPRPREHTSLLLQQAAAALDLDEHALADLTAEDRRTKYEELSSTRLVTSNAVRLDEPQSTLTVEPVSMLVTDRALICLVEPLGADFDPARLLAQRSRSLAAGGVELGLQLVVEAVVASYEQVVDRMEDGLDELSDVLLGQRPLDSDQQLRAFQLRRLLSQLRHLTEPMRGVLDDLTGSQPPESSSGRRWAMLRERQHRVADRADGLREALSSLLDASSGLTQLRRNQSIQKLTGWAAIVAVPTLVTGFAGQNVRFPLAGTGVGFWVYLLLMVAAVVVLFVLFRRRGWI